MDIRVPAMGESVTEASVGRWFKQVGEAVKADEPLVELETDKVTLEVNAPVSGVLSGVVAKPGDTVGVGALLGAIAEGASASAAPALTPGNGKEKRQPAALPRAETASAAPSAPLSPAVRRLLAENAMEPSQVTATGRGGRILKGDVLEVLQDARSQDSRLQGSRPQEARRQEVRPQDAGFTRTETPPPAVSPAPDQPAIQVSGSAAAVLSAVASLPSAAVARIARAPAATADEGREERVRMTKLRQTIARRLKEAQNTAAMLTTFNEVDMSAIIAARNQYKSLFEHRHGVKLGFMGFFVIACVNALKEIPSVNAEIDGDDIIYKNYYHIGIAVGSGRGLVVPVIRNADQMSIADIEKTIADYGARANEGKLSMEEMQGGTFTISNGGVYGSLLSTPILNAPQSGILGMHKIQERPVVVKGEIKIRPMMYLALTYDHRLVDGREAVTFLVRVKEGLEDPQRLVLNL
jgi:2-oxoglutarate dehydrogenase E2 component (dihydrolipoamide succinyltransferase)